MHIVSVSLIAKDHVFLRWSHRSHIKSKERNEKQLWIIKNRKIEIESLFSPFFYFTTISVFEEWLWSSFMAPQASFFFESSHWCPRIIECFITTTQGVPAGWRHCEPHPQQQQEGWGGQPLIHRYHGFVTGGGSDWEENKDLLLEHTTDNRPFRNLRSGLWGSASLFAPHGRSWDPGYTLFFLSVNFHSYTVEDGRPGGVHHQSDVPF